MLRFWHLCPHRQEPTREAIGSRLHAGGAAQPRRPRLLPLWHRRARAEQLFRLHRGELTDAVEVRSRFRGRFRRDQVPRGGRPPARQTVDEREQRRGKGRRCGTLAQARGGDATMSTKLELPACFLPVASHYYARRAAAPGSKPAAASSPMPGCGAGRAPSRARARDATTSASLPRPTRATRSHDSFGRYSLPGVPGAWKPFSLARTRAR